MRITRSRNLLPFVFSVAAICILFAAPRKIVAATDPDLPATPNAEPHSTADQMKLAQQYLDGRGVEQDAKKAAYWYEKAAGAGDPFAQFETGYFYEAGIGVEKSPVRAVHWYQLAAASGQPSAEVNLAVAYLWGTGMARDESAAFRLMSKAAAHDNGLAACYLGDFYAFGIGTLKDRAKAERWYRKGASLHDPIAEFDLALMQIHDEDGRDLSGAAKLLRDSATAGYVPAMHELGLLLVRNPNLAESPREALELLNAAAEAGNWRSSVLLGVLERDGNGVPVDAEGAYYHFRVAALQSGTQGSQLVDYDLRLLATRLGQERVDAIDAKANEWYKLHPLEVEFVQIGEKSLREFAVVRVDGEHVARMLTSPTL